MIDDVEALLARGIIDGGNVDDADELTRGIVPQEGGDLHDLGGGAGDRQFAVLDLMAGDNAGQSVANALAEIVKDRIHNRTCLALDRAGPPDLLLQEQDPIEQRLSGRWTSGHIDVDRHYLEAYAHHRIGIMIVAAAVRA